MKKLASLFLICGSLTVCHAQSSFTANLTSSQEVPPNFTGAYGSIEFTLTGSMLSSEGEGSFDGFMGQEGPITVNDAAPGINGPVLFDLQLGAASSLDGIGFGFFGGSGALTTGQITDLEAGDLYVNFAAAFYPNGEMRGQIEPAPEPLAPALIAAASLALLAAISLRRHGKTPADLRLL